MVLVVQQLAPSMWALDLWRAQLVPILLAPYQGKPST
jgi:hypothetical protein